MARIADSRGRDDDNSGYTRLLGVPELGQLLSRVHATVIRNGNELERVLAERCPHRTTGLRARIEGALTLFTPPLEAYFAEALHVADGDRETTADVVVVDNVARLVRVVEIKDGDVFDTKKADGELASLQPLALMIGRCLEYTATYHLCCFNQEDKAAIARGLKGRFQPEELMTGIELCQLLEVDYVSIRRQRDEDIRANLEFMVGELLRIEALGHLVRSYLAPQKDTPPGEGSGR